MPLVLKISKDQRRKLTHYLVYSKRKLGNYWKKGISSVYFNSFEIFINRNILKIYRPCKNSYYGVVSWTKIKQISDFFSNYFFPGKSVSVEFKKPIMYIMSDYVSNFRHYIVSQRKLTRFPQYKFLVSFVGTIRRQTFTCSRLTIEILDKSGICSKLTDTIATLMTSF